MRAEGVEGPELINEGYRRLEMSGGYFRNAYNESDVMWSLGLSWEMVRAMLDADHRLPIAKAKELLALLEAHTPDKQAYVHMLDHHSHPTARMLADLVEQATDVRREVSFEYDALFDHVVRKYRTLLALLRKSIALNEPLRCSL
jgi:hypothetical protein